MFRPLAVDLVGLCGCDGGSSWVVLGGFTLCGSAPFAPTREAVLVRSIGLVSDSAMLDLRGGLGPAELTLEALA